MSEAELDKLIEQYEFELKEGINEIIIMLKAVVYGSFIIIFINVISLFIIGFSSGFL